MLNAIVWGEVNERTLVRGYSRSQPNGRKSPQRYTSFRQIFLRSLLKELFFCFRTKLPPNHLFRLVWRHKMTIFVTKNYSVQIEGWSRELSLEWPLLVLRHKKIYIRCKKILQLCPKYEDFETQCYKDHAKCPQIDGYMSVVCHWATQLCNMSDFGAKRSIQHMVNYDQKCSRKLVFANSLLSIRPDTWYFTRFSCFDCLTYDVSVPNSHSSNAAQSGIGHRKGTTISNAVIL